MKKPKIAIIHPSVGESFGGSQIFVLELAQKLKKYCDITILSANNANELCKPIFSLTRKSDSKTKNIIKNLIKGYSSTPEVVIEHLSSFFPVLFDLLTNDYDLIYPNNDWGGLLTASIARKIKGTPILFTEHCGFMDKGKIANRNLSFKPDKYIVLSESLKFWVKKYYSNIDVDYIPNGINFEKFNPSIKPVDIDLPRPIFLASSRNQPNKRLNLTIKAVSKLKEGSLLILCPDENKKELEEAGIAALGENRFKLMSAPYEDIPSYYKACDVFTLPSQYEPFGLVYLEAMACNKPVVATKDMSRKDLIGKGGILCEVRDIEAYSACLKAAYIKDFKDLPYEQAQKYSWEATAAEYLNIINSMTKN